MKFLGTCNVCGRIVRTYRSLSMHLRMNPDDAHTALKTEWLAWKNTYRSTLRCRKCGSLWENHNKGDKDKKNCPRCIALRQSLTKREYEAYRPTMKPDPRQVMTGGSKASWDGVVDRKVKWSPHDDLYVAIVNAAKEGDGADGLALRFGVPRGVARPCQRIYRNWCPDEELVR